MSANPQSQPQLNRQSKPPIVAWLPLNEGLSDLALALAARGDSLILWDPLSTPGPIPPPVLDLQLALERAGGISLYQAGPDTAGAAEALGHIDAAVAPTPATARLFADAASRLERRLRPARLIVLEDEKSQPLGQAAPLPSLPPGMRLVEAPFNASAPEFLAAMLALIG